MGKWRYGIILDAGSSGTRIHIYRWLDGAIARQEASQQQLQSLPSLETHDKWTKKTHPGVSSFGATPELVGTDHLEPLLQHALEIIPKHAVENTPIFLLGTAGMRLLPDAQREELLQQICAYTRSKTKFLLPDCDVHIQVIPGETEGLYGWIATNYLLGGFDSPENHAHGKGHHTYGFLDMGGASAQIAFAPNATEAIKHANDLVLLRLRTLDGSAAEYQVFVTTWLGFGANEARRRYIDALLQSVGTSETSELPDPCLPANLRMTIKDKLLLGDADKPVPGEPYLLGTGNFDECLRQTYPLLDKDAPCEDEPCLLHGVHVPAIDFDVNHFIGISEYWHTTHEIFEMGHTDKAYDFTTYQTRVKEFCSKDWTAIEQEISAEKFGRKVDVQTAYEVCFKASWLINVLHNGIGIPRLGLENTQGNGFNGTKEVITHGKEKGFLEPFQAVNKIKSTEVSWTLGKMVLYAASQVPPLDDSSLPVGFGSNVMGIPTDFQYPAGGKTPYEEKGPDEDEPLSDQIHDTLFNSDSPRRIPGFVLFVLILCIVAFFLCGRDRRSRLFHKVVCPSAKNRRLFGGRFPFLFSSGPVVYERVLEDGSAMDSPDRFELGDMDSDHFGGTRDLENSAWSTPRKTSPVGLTPPVMDKRGMVLRSESTERLGLSNSGRKSRTGSPIRAKTGLAPWRED